MTTLRQNEGYLLLDHRHADSPVPDEIMIASGMPVGAGRGLFEAPTYTCNHCQKVCIVKMPRDTEVPYCRGCHHNICNTCGKFRADNGGVCKTMNQVIDEILEAAHRQASPASLILP